GNCAAGGNLEVDSLEDRTVGIVGKMHVLEADGAVHDDQRPGVGPVDHFGPDVEQVEHLLDIGQSLPDLTIDGTDIVQRDGKLNQHGVDEDEVAERLRAAHDRQR